MRKKENSLGDPSSLFRMDFPNGRLSWAEQIYLGPSRCVDAFREQLQKVCIEVDDWLTPIPDERVKLLAPTPPIDNRTLSEFDQGLGSTINREVPIGKELEPHPKNLVNGTALEKGLPMPEEGCQKSSNYIDVFREQVQQMLTDVDDWFKPILAERIQPPVFFLGKVHEISEPTFQAMEPTTSEIEADENNLRGNMLPDIGAPPNMSKIDNSSKFSGCRSSADSVVPHHALDKELRSIKSGPLEYGISGIVHGSCKVELEDSHNVGSSFNELEEKNLAFGAHEPSVTKHASVFSDGGECNMSFNMPPTAPFDELQNVTWSLPELDTVRTVSGIDERPTDVKPLPNEVDLAKNNFTANLGYQSGDSYMKNHKNHTQVSSEVDGYGLHFDVPQHLQESQGNFLGADFLEHEISSKVHSSLEEQKRHTLTEIEPDLKRSTGNLKVEMQDTSISVCCKEYSTCGQGCSLLVDLSQCTCIERGTGTFVKHLISAPLPSYGDNRGDVSGSSFRSSDVTRPSSLVSEPRNNFFIWKHDATKTRDRDAFSAVGVTSNSYDDILELPGNDGVQGTMSTKLEEFEDVELEDCWDDLDYEELSILHQRHNANFSYKKKLKNTWRSISWPLKKKPSVPSVHNTISTRVVLSSPSWKNTNHKGFGKDPAETGWELV